MGFLRKCSKFRQSIPLNTTKQLSSSVTRVQANEMRVVNQRVASYGPTCCAPTSCDLTNCKPSSLQVDEPLANKTMSCGPLS